LNAARRRKGERACDSVAQRRASVDAAAGGRGGEVQLVRSRGV